jgi:rSAM/selenodomain-associated transferase 2
LPSLSIIVPVLNESRDAPALAQRLSALSQHHIVIVDGGSRDDTAQLLSRAARVVSGPRGRAAQMNHGARDCVSDVLVFLHADTGFSPQHAHAAQQTIARGADFGCFTLRIDSRDPRLRLAGHAISLRSRLMSSATGDQVIFMRRSLFEVLGGYREIALCEDLDLVARARQRGRFFCVNREVSTSARRWEQRGITRTILLVWILRLGCHAGIDPARLRKFYEDVR